MKEKSIFLLINFYELYIMCFNFIYSFSFEFSMVQVTVRVMEKFYTSKRKTIGYFLLDDFYLIKSKIFVFLCNICGKLSVILQYDL